MSGKTLFSIIWLGSLGLITAVDYMLGPTAEYLNAWEIIKQTFSPGQTPGSRFLFCQDNLGTAALPAGWILFFVEGMVIAMIILGIIMLARYLARRG